MVQPYSYRSDPGVPAFPDDKAIFLYDGYCAMCSRWVQFVLRHDRQARFRLLPAQSPLGEALYRHYGLDPQDHETNMLIEKGLPYFKAESSIRIVAAMGFPLSLARLARVLPGALLEKMYDVVARNRMRWFGRRESCMLSCAGYEDRFIG
jgi:predicted DCC family thiol-disulfide oxidoreductase YuxK